MKNIINMFEKAGFSVVYNKAYSLVFATDGAVSVSVQRTFASGPYCYSAVAMDMPLAEMRALPRRKRPEREGFDLEEEGWICKSKTLHICNNDHAEWEIASALRDYKKRMQRSR